MNRNQIIGRFMAMCEAVGSEATEAQSDRLTSWALENFGTDDYGLVMQIAAENGISALVTEFSMRKGECGC